MLLVAAVAAVVLGSGCAADRQAEVAERGASVMPFDLERTTHRFTKTDTGGVQTVVADDARDTVQITLIQEHLTAEVDRFRRGDFTDPARIHGTEMPGLDSLRAHGGRIAIELENTADGARATYTTSDTELRTALHAWFDAQVSDHGAHATS
ncbi:MAG: aspartate carbamoyltransferase [Saccharothrix sp.]|nr:aspartate carbamoyltransferase [Saccharothrix sp.]